MGYKGGVYIIRLEHTNAPTYGGKLLTSTMTGVRYYLHDTDPATWMPQYDWELASKWYVDNATTASITGYSGFWQRFQRVPYGYQLVPSVSGDWLSIGTDYFNNIFKFIVNGDSSLSGNVLINNNVTASRHYVYSSLTSSWIPLYNWELTTKYYVDSLTSNSGTASVETFTNATPVPVTLGGVTAGSTFSNASVTSVLNTLLYPYLSHVVTLSINTNLCEKGFDPTVALAWAITKRTNNIIGASMPNSNFNPVLPITSTTANSASGNWVMNTDRTWTLTATDGTTNTTNSTTLYFRYPYFYGMTASDLTSGGFGLYTGLTKLLAFQGNKTVLLNGTSQYIYFCYDSTYPDLTSILDNNGFEVIAAFTKYASVSVDYVSPKTGWPKTYTVYRTTATTNVSSANFQFKY